jgi:hypothetical protein
MTASDFRPLISTARAVANEWDCLFDQSIRFPCFLRVAKKGQSDWFATAGAVGIKVGIKRQGRGEQRLFFERPALESCVMIVAPGGST